MRYTIWREPAVLVWREPEPNGDSASVPTQSVHTAIFAPVKPTSRLHAADGVRVPGVSGHQGRRACSARCCTLATKPCKLSSRKTCALGWNPFELSVGLY